MATVRQFSVAALKLGSPLVAGAIVGLVLTERADEIEKIFRTKIAEPLKRARADAERFIASYQGLLEVEAQVQEQRRRADNLAFYGYSQVDFGEGLFVAEEYNPASIRMAESHSARKAEREAEVQSPLSGKR